MIQIKILEFLNEELERKQEWSYHYEVEEKFGISAEVWMVLFEELEKNKFINTCECGCHGFMISPGGLEQIKPQKKIVVWKTCDGNHVRITHMSDEHLRNAIVWLLVDSALDDLYEGVPITKWVKDMAIELHSRAGA